VLYRTEGRRRHRIRSADLPFSPRRPPELGHQI
jgi:hypothetical protein